MATSTNGEDEQKGGGGSSSSSSTIHAKTLLKSESLYHYILETSVDPREPECLRELRRISAAHPRNIMTSAPDEVQFFGMLLKILNAKNTIELGVFTGYSLLATALALPHDGKEKNKGTLDFAFVDADKSNYLNYHERLVELVRVGGVIAYDNTLWEGTVAAPPDAPLSERDRMISEIMRAFNSVIAADPRVEISHLSIADGLTLCRRLG
ncbi:caffeoyl-CoA O-methyltransferase 1-like isoform X2 [Ananas comosus]|uniref:Caffeoyl-CoA O-methyltransferase 1-like isoform X2 n=1 Tax=Ananas comosus TaxID=4615 RepID=A0A6P5EAS7_ANACO|nr:caffeoyl-CoA O-methyltransferase 1-like isoform X2 [Ananas comosus]